MWALLWQQYLQGVIIGLIVFILYLELRPDLGGLFLRPGQKGETVLEWGGFWQLWLDLLPGRGGLPLWSLAYLDMNPVVVSHTVAIFYLLLCRGADLFRGEGGILWNV